MSRREQQRHYEENGLERSLVPVNAHSSIFHLVRGLDIPGARPREWLVRYVWKWKDEKKEEMALGYETLGSSEEYPANPRWAKVTCYCLWAFKRLKKVWRVDQTLVTVTMRVDLGGHISHIVERGLGVQELIGVSMMRQQFDKSLEVDGEVRAENMKMIAEHDAAYDDYEKACFSEGEQHFPRFEAMKAKSLKMASPLTRAKLAFKSGDRQGWGWATTSVRASPEEVLAWMLDVMKRCGQYADEVEKNVQLFNGGSGEASEAKLAVCKTGATRSSIPSV